jgi:SAM-dependent methyltransferase
MDHPTRDALRALNRAFYRARADDFAATRDHPWPGWERLPLPAAAATPGALRVLDVACGNGRLAPALRARIGHGFAYTGIDESPAMLRHARAALARTHDVVGDLRAIDVLEPDPDATLPAGPFDLVVAFGLLHHVPGRATRTRLLACLAGRVAPGGVLAFTAWQFADRPRFAGRIVPWRGEPGSPGPAIDPGRLEPGDHLVAFGAADEPLRYCHHCDDAELDALASALPLEPLDRYAADGRSGDLNRYVVLRRAAPAPPATRP